MNKYDICEKLKEIAKDLKKASKLQPDNLEIFNMIYRDVAKLHNDLKDNTCAPEDALKELTEVL